MTTLKANNLEFIRLLLAKIKKEQGLRQYQIAKRLNTKPSVISKWINENTKPYDNSIFEVAKEFGIDIVKHTDGLFYLKGEEPNNQAHESPGEYHINSPLNALTRMLQLADQVKDQELKQKLTHEITILSIEITKIMEKAMTLREKLQALKNQ